MQEINLTIPQHEFVKLNELYPNNGKSSIVGERAVALVKLHFRSKDDSCTFEKPADGGDLKITGRHEILIIEVKGTSDKDISWPQLKVSGRPSYEALAGDMPLYRVCGVFERSPLIYVLRYSRDFDMIPEPRWSLRPRKYQLRNSS